MSQAQAERAINSMYEDENLIGELPDPEAGVLMQWGEGQLTALAERNLPDDAFDALAMHMQHLLMYIAQFIAKRDEMTQMVQEAALNEIETQARVVGLTITDMNAYLQSQQTLTPEEAVRALALRFQPIAQTDNPN
jgi:hypothetical protein